jgi:transcription initiation factor IIE alpha subunit
MSVQIYELSISPAARIILYAIQDKGQLPIEELMKILNLSKRQVQRYLKEVTNLSPVSSSNIINNLNTNTQDQVKETTTNTDIANTNDKIGALLDKYGKRILLADVLKRILEPNEKALEWLINDCQKHYKQSFYRYFMWSLSNPSRWSQAVIESQEQSSKPIEQYIPQEEKIDRPDSDQQAQKYWNNYINHLPISDFIKNAWFKTAIPIKLENNILTLSVSNEYAALQIKKYAPALQAIFEVVDYQHRATL